MNAHDFATLFAYAWYRDFPVDITYRPATMGRADWTIHIGLVVRTVADLMGLFTHFESGNRFDAVVKDNAGTSLAHVEWEWGDPSTEARKLASVCATGGTKLCVLVCYRTALELPKFVVDLAATWPAMGELLLIAVECHGSRTFDKVHFYRIEAGVPTLLRRQEALPWNVKGTRWERDSSGTP